MIVKMVSAGPRISVIMLGNEEYRPNKDGIFEVLRDHVDEPRSRGLMIAGEAGVVQPSQRKTVDTLRAENEALRKQLAAKTNTKTT